MAPFVHPGVGRSPYCAAESGHLAAAAVTEVNAIGSLWLLGIGKAENSGLRELFLLVFFFFWNIACR